MLKWYLLLDIHGVGTGLLCHVSTLCAEVVPPAAGLYGVVGTGLLRDVSTLCAVEPPPGLNGVVGTGLLGDVSTLCAEVVPPPGLYGAWCLLHGTLLLLVGALDDGSHAHIHNHAVSHRVGLLTLLFRLVMVSFCATPNRCSSSITNSATCE